MNESDTPITDREECNLNEAMPFVIDRKGVQRPPRMFVASEVARNLERRNKRLVEALRTDLEARGGMCLTVHQFAKLNAALAEQQEEKT